MASLRCWQAVGISLTVLVAALAAPRFAHAGAVTLQNATATCSQNDGSGNFSVDEAINGIVNNSDGWAIFCGGFPVAQTAVFETSADVTGADLLIFTLKQQYQTPHTLGRFRLSATTASRDDFADGLDNAGNMGMADIWTVLDPTAADSTGGAVLTEQGDNSILASGTEPPTATYAVIVPTTLSPITGIRLEVLEDSSLPFMGPGRQPTNGNFVLTELTLDAEQCTTDQLDVDDDDELEALSDALLILRRAFGFSDAALTTGALGPLCMRCSAGDIATYIDQLGSKLDIDGDGAVDALTDALLILRYAFGFRGNALIGGAVDPDCERCDAFVIEAYLACLFV